VSDVFKFNRLVNLTRVTMPCTGSPKKPAPGDGHVRGTPPARRERGELSFAPAPVLQAAAGGLEDRRWSLAGLTPSSTVRRLSALDRLGSARPVRHRGEKE